MNQDRFVLNTQQLAMKYKTNIQKRIGKSTPLQRAQLKSLNFPDFFAPRESLHDENNNILETYTKKRKAEIIASPTRILDAPGLIDDFYLNLLDWNLKGFVNIALGTEVYSYDFKQSTSECLGVASDYNLGKNVYISAVQSIGNGGMIAVANSSGCLTIVDLESKKKICKGTTKGQERIAVLANKYQNGIFDDHLLFSGSTNGRINVYDLRTRRIFSKPVMTLDGHSLEVCGLDLEENGWGLASGSNDNSAKIWDFRTSSPLHTQNDYNAAVKALNWCPWQRGLLAVGSGSGDRRIRFWNTSTNTCMSEIKVKSQVTGTFWSKHYSELVTTHGYGANEISIWKYPENKEILTLKAHSTRILCSAMSPDGTLIATSSPNESLKFWKLYKDSPSLRRPRKRSPEGLDFLWNRFI